MDFKLRKSKRLSIVDHNGIPIFTKQIKDENELINKIITLSP